MNTSQLISNTTNPNDNLFHTPRNPKPWMPRTALVPTRFWIICSHFIHASFTYLSIILSLLYILLNSTSFWMGMFLFTWQCFEMITPNWVYLHSTLKLQFKSKNFVHVLLNFPLNHANKNKSLIRNGALEGLSTYVSDSTKSETHGLTHFCFVNLSKKIM